MDLIDKNENAEKEKVAEKKNPPWLIIILTGTFLLAALALGAFYLLTGNLPFLTRDGSVTVENSVPRYTYSMREFQVNLADSGSRRFLRMTIDLAYDERALAKELEERDSELRSHIIAVLRSKYVVDLDEPGGMENLERDILQRLNALLEKGDIRAVYYKELIYQ